MRRASSLTGFVLATALAACAQQSADTAPTSSSAAATVVVLRARDFSTEPIEVRVNGRAIARLQPDKWRRFTLDSGTHAIGTAESQLSVTMQPRARYWFLVSTAGQAVRQLDSTEAARRLAEANSPRNVP